MIIVCYIFLLCYVLYFDKLWFYEIVLRKKKKYCLDVKIKLSFFVGKGIFSFQFGIEMCQ